MAGVEDEHSGARAQGTAHADQAAAPPEADTKTGLDAELDPEAAPDAETAQADTAPPAPPPPATGLIARYDAGLAALAAEERRRFKTRFVHDVFAHPTVGPTAGWLIGGLLALVAAITHFYAPGAPDRPSELDCTADPSLAGCIRVEAGFWTIAGVSLMTLIAGLAPVLVRRVPLERFASAGPWLAAQPIAIQAPLATIALIAKFVFFLPALAFSVLDFVFARLLAWLAGAKLQPWPKRYGALIAWMAALLPAAWFLDPPWGMIAAGYGMALVFAITRRWSWVERDREAFFVARQARPEQERIGFAEDLRDEALTALVFLFLLMPLFLRQLQLFDAETFVGGTEHAGNPLVWLGFFGAELAKSVPFVDWSEVFHAENGAPIKPGSFMGSVAVFTTRAALDVLLIAAVVQAIQLAARLAEQNAAFEEGTVDILEPFGERRRFRAIAAAAQSAALERVLEHPAIREFPKYSPLRLEQIIRGGDRAPAVQAEADPAARWAAMLLARRQLDAGAATRAAQPVLRSDEPRLRDMARRTVVAGVMDQMTPVPAGSFWMGSADGEGVRNERPRHKVTVPAFEIGKYPVTFDEFDAFCAATGFAPPSDNGWGRGRRPVINVSWEDAQAYISWLKEITGDPFRLPSESEWEYACRAVSSPDAPSTTWSFGDDESLLGEHAWFEGNSNSQTHPVGEKPANPFGLYDMHGNVWEWCADRWHESYDGADRPDDGRAWVSGSDTRRVVRGGSWNFDPQVLRSAIRGWLTPSNRNYDIGFRLARTILR